MKRIERLTALLSLLQSRRFTSIDKIEEKFRISERTAFRDIRALAESGVPISFEKGKGYFVLEGHFLPPLAFTIEEAKSFIFMEQLARKYTDREIFQQFSSALEKIKNKLRNSQLADIENLEARVQAYVNPAYQTQYLSLIEQACDQQRILHIHYQNFNGKQTERLIEPIGITFYSQAWHVIAYCQLRDAYRDFSLQRILELRNTGECTSRIHLTLAEYIRAINDE